MPLSLLLECSIIARPEAVVRGLVFGGSKSKRFLTRKPKDRLYQAYLHVTAQHLNNR